MKATIYLAALLILIAAPAAVQAQYYGNNHNNLPDNDVSLSEGIVTLEEINGWAGKGGASGYISMPSSLTGASFITYRHFFTKRFALGFTAGLDNESGDLSYGNPENNNNGMEGNSGYYTVRSYTFAVEALFAYLRKNRFMFYGYGGMGPTLYRQNYYFYPNAYNPPPVTLPTNPYDYRTTYMNAQITPIGIRFGGNVAGYFEMGVGYKGLLNLGLSARF